MALPTSLLNSLPASLRDPSRWPEADREEVAALLAKKTRKPADVWQPQEKQRQLLELCGLDQALHGGMVQPAVSKYVGYGGAVYGGKTEGMLGIALIAMHQIPSVKIGYFRRTYPLLKASDGPIERSYSLFPKLGFTYNETDHIWREVGEADDEDWDKGKGAALRFCHLQYEKTVHDYQSAAFDIMLWDESTEFSWPQVRYMLTRNRPSKWCKIPRPFSVMCTNPGNIGHLWYKTLFGIQDRLREVDE